MIEQRYKRLTTNFYLLSFLITFSMMPGQQTWQLLWVYLGFAVAGIVLNDYLKLVQLNRLGAYFLMLAGTLVAIAEYFLEKDPEQLLAVTHLLVYVQGGLMLQQRSLRMFEHWSIFLMLELIVSSLLNDNVLFGLALIPITLSGLSTLLAYCSAVTHQNVDAATFDPPQTASWWSRLWTAFYPRRSAKRQIIMARQPSKEDEVLRGSRVGLRRAAVLLLGVIPFAAGFFFLTPRLQKDAYEGVGYARAAVGFSDEVRLDDMRQLLETNDAAIKVSFYDVNLDRDYLPIEPPYVRGSVVYFYLGGGVWRAGGADDRIVGPMIDPPMPNEIEPKLVELADKVEMIVEEQVPFGSTAFAAPPLAQSDGRASLQVKEYDWRLIHKRQSSSDRLKYRFQTYGFSKGQQLRAMPEVEDSLETEVRKSRQRDEARELYITQTTFLKPELFPRLIRVRDEILSSASRGAIPAENIVQKVLALEDFLSSDRSFTYSLAPSPNRKEQLDPIEDFIGNHRTGHCQYFASTMCMMLRSMGIPARIVVGFRPSEYNMTGLFFMIRQRHAHAWVEALLPVDQLQAVGINVPNVAGQRAWLRLDPTPPGEGSNAGGSIRSRLNQFETLDSLWKEYVMDVNSQNQSGLLNFLTENTDGSLADILRNAQMTLLTLQTNQLIGGFLQPSNWFSWEAPVAIVGAGLLTIGLYMALRRLLGLLGLINITRNVDARRLTAQTVFYRRLVRALSRLQLRRHASQTPTEFALFASDNLRLRFPEHQQLTNDIIQLTDTYCRLRYGEADPPGEEEADSLELAVRRIEDLAAVRKNRRGRQPIAAAH